MPTINQANNSFKVIPILVLWSGTISFCLRSIYY